jgi:Family of unknown function (DUF6152)
MKIRVALIAAALSLAAVAPVFAHHSFAAEFDLSKPINVAGSVTKLEWINPHARLYLDVKGSDGKVVNWEIELGPPAMLIRNGWTKNSLKAGEMVTVTGSLAKDGSNLANATSVTLADGTKVFAGSSAPGQTPSQNNQ